MRLATPPADSLRSPMRLQARSQAASKRDRGRARSAPRGRCTRDPCGRQSPVQDASSGDRASQAPSGSGGSCWQQPTHRPQVSSPRSASAAYRRCLWGVCCWKRLVDTIFSGVEAASEPACCLVWSVFWVQNVKISLACVPKTRGRSKSVRSWQLLFAANGIRWLPSPVRELLASPELCRNRSAPSPRPPDCWKTSRPVALSKRHPRSHQCIYISVISTPVAPATLRLAQRCLCLSNCDL